MTASSTIEITLKSQLKLLPRPPSKKTRETVLKQGSPPSVRSSRLKVLKLIREKRKKLTYSKKRRSKNPA